MKRNKGSQDVLTMSLTNLIRAHPDYSVRCGVILVREEDGKILAVTERARGDFCGNVLGPPKGRACMQDRDYWDAACRELYEETGVLLTPSHKEHSRASAIEVILSYDYRRDIMVIFVVLASRAMLSNEPSPDDREIVDCRWMTMREILETKNKTHHMERIITTLAELARSARTSM